MFPLCVHEQVLCEPTSTIRANQIFLQLPVGGGKRRVKPGALQLVCAMKSFHFHLAAHVNRLEQSHSQRVEGGSHTAATACY